MHKKIPAFSTLRASLPDEVTDLKYNHYPDIDFLFVWSREYIILN